MRWSTRISAVGVAVVLAACQADSKEAGEVAATASSDRVVSAPPPSEASVPDTTVPATVHSNPIDDSPEADRVEMVVTGVVERNPDGSAELCQFPGVCFGIPVAGQIDHVLDGRYVRATGHFDGVALVLDAPPEELPSPYEAPSFEPLCGDVPTGGRLDQLGIDAVARYLEAVPDVYAGTWIDASQRVATYWFVGDDVTEHRAAIGALAGDAAVCVAGGARWSYAELTAVSDRVAEILQGPRRTGTSWGVHELRNVVVVNLRLLESPLRAELQALGDQVSFGAYIELLDATSDRLPAIVPVMPGDLPILTQRDGGRNGEEALGRFVMRFDESLGCVWFEGAGSGQRYLPVWPDGYTATSDPVVVRDFDGLVVAAENDRVELGGGFHDPSTVARWSDGTEHCGAVGSDAMFVITR